MLLTSLAVSIVLHTDWAAAAQPLRAEPCRCYDFAIIATVPEQHHLATLDDGFNGEFRWKINVEKVYAGGRLPDRIEATRIAHTYYTDRYLTHAVLFLRRGEDGRFSVVGVEGLEMLDGRKLVSRGRVNALAREKQLAPCPTPPDHG